MLKECDRVHVYFQRIAESGGVFALELRHLRDKDAALPDAQSKTAGMVRRRGGFSSPADLRLEHNPEKPADFSDKIIRPDKGKGSAIEST